MKLVTKKRHNLFTFGWICRLVHLGPCGAFLGKYAKISRSRSAVHYSEGWGGGAGDIRPSREFTSLSQAQFQLLADTLGVERATLFFRRENAESGMLEFTPVAVYPEQQRVWVVGDTNITSRPKRDPLKLSGFTLAGDLMPDYPFISIPTNTKNRGVDQPSSAGSETSAGTTLEDPLIQRQGVTETADGGLSAPLLYGSVVVGMLVIWRGRGVPDSVVLGGGEDFEWGPRAHRLIGHVAHTLAVAVALDQADRSGSGSPRGVTAASEQQVSLELGRSIREILHQAKNPLTALRTFGQLLLRRLDKDDSVNRQLAKDIIMQSDRVVDILAPIDRVASSLAALPPKPLPPVLLGNTTHSLITNTQCESQSESGQQITVRTESQSRDSTGQSSSLEDHDHDHAPPVPKAAASPPLPPSTSSSWGYATDSVVTLATRELTPQVCWVGDVIAPILSAHSWIAEREGVTLKMMEDSQECGN